MFLKISLYHSVINYSATPDCYKENGADILCQTKFLLARVVLERNQMPPDLERLYDEHAQAMFAFLLNFTHDVIRGPLARIPDPIRVEHSLFRSISNFRQKKEKHGILADTVFDET